MHGSEHSSKLSSPSVDPYPLPVHWKTFVCIEENLRYVFNKFMQFPILFEDDTRGDLKRFCHALISPSTIAWLTGDYGLAALTDIVPFRDANVHLCFWDRRFKGRRLEIIQAIKWSFDKLSLARLTDTIPETSRASVAFVASLGFKKEGIIRQDYLYKGKLLNTIKFGLLREEAFKLKEA